MSSTDMTDDNESNMIPSLNEDAAAEMALVAIPEFSRIDTRARIQRRQIRALLKL